MVVCGVHFLASAFTLKAVFLWAGLCVCAQVRLCICLCASLCVYVSVLKAEWHSEWLILHVKLKLAPPEHRNKLPLATTVRPEMTAGHAPIPINLYFPLYSAHLLPFLELHKNRFYLALQKKRAISERGKKMRRKKSFYRKKESICKRELTVYFQFFTSAVIIDKKICAHHTRYSKGLLFRHGFIPFLNGSQ